MIQGMDDIFIQVLEEDGEEWAVVKRNKKDGSSYFYINPKNETEFAQMDYR